MLLTTVPGRAGVEPRLAIAYDGAGDGVLGAGFSLAGLSAITRCAKNLAQDGEISAVRYDADDALCLDGKRLVVVGQSEGTIEYRTFPDTHVKVVGHQPGASKPAEAESFEAFLPSGMVVEYGMGASGKPLTPDGSAQAWLATKAHDRRGNAMTYDYCLADGGGYTAEVVLDQIRYTSFEGEPALEASRAVTFVYGMKDEVDVRTRYAGGMALSSALRLEEIDVLGPEDTLVRRYGLTYELGPTTKRTRLSKVKACGSDGVCKPPTRFQYRDRAVGFDDHTTTLAAPTSALASPMLFDLDGDGLDDLVVPDAVPGLSTPGNPITRWTVAHNQGRSASPPYLAVPAIALTEDWTMVGSSSGPSDPAGLQPELGTAMDYNGDGRTDLLVHDVAGTSPTWLVLLAQPDHTFKLHDTGLRRPFPLGAPPKPPGLTSAGASTHLADVDGDGART